jgi:hypothetical protein
MSLARAAIEVDLGRLTGLLARGGPEDIREARRVVSSLRRAVARPPTVHTEEEPTVGQLRLRLRLLPEAIVRDCPISCPPQCLAAPSALVCVARQLANELDLGKGPAKKRSSRAKRGRVGKFVSCKTELCRVGALARLLLGDRDDAREMAARAPRASDTSET